MRILIVGLAFMFAAAALPVSAQEVQREELAQMQIRIMQLENELRRMTGKYEEAVYLNTKLQAEFERFREDVDFRLRALEGGAPGPSTAAASAESPSPSTSYDYGTTESGGPAPLPPGAASATAPTRTASLPPGADTAPSGAAAPPASVLPEGAPEEQYGFAMQLMRTQKYADAAAAMQEFLQKHPEHPLAANAQYWLGEAYYVRNMYDDAARAFLQTFQSHQDSDKAPGALVKLGISLGALDQTDQACAALAEFFSSYPNASPLLQDRAKTAQAETGCS